jgi:hypothetical protein
MDGGGRPDQEITDAGSGASICAFGEGATAQ